MPAGSCYSSPLGLAFYIDAQGVAGEPVGQEDKTMLKQNKIEAAIEELARLQGHELNATDMLELRCRVSSTLAAKERHRQRMTAPEYHWRKPAPRR